MEDKDEPSRNEVSLEFQKSSASSAKRRTKFERKAFGHQQTNST